MINEIKKRLEAGEVVELECIDREGFISGLFSNYNTLLLDSNLVVIEADESGVTLSHKSQAIAESELKYFKIKETQDEVDQLIQSRSNGAYSDIAADTLEIMRILGLDSERSYTMYQIVAKLVRIKHCYSVEDSLLDIAGYAKLELERLRNEKAR